MSCVLQLCRVNQQPTSDLLREIWGPHTNVRFGGQIVFLHLKYILCNNLSLGLCSMEIIHGVWGLPAGYKANVLTPNYIKSLAREKKNSDSFSLPLLQADCPNQCSHNARPPQKFVHKSYACAHITCTAAAQPDSCSFQWLKLWQGPSWLHRLTQPNAASRVNHSPPLTWNYSQSRPNGVSRMYCNGPSCGLTPSKSKQCPIVSQSVCTLWATCVDVDENVAWPIRVGSDQMNYTNIKNPRDPWDVMLHHRVIGGDVTLCIDSTLHCTCKSPTRQPVIHKKTIHFQLLYMPHLSETWWLWSHQLVWDVWCTQFVPARAPVCASMRCSSWSRNEQSPTYVARMYEHAGTIGELSGQHLIHPTAIKTPK